MSNKCLVVVVTYNSEKHIQWCVSGLDNINGDIEIRIVDSGSTNTEYLDNLVTTNKLSVIKEENIGFVSGNNRALFDIDEFDWVLFLNPDARIESDCLENLLNFAARPEQKNVGVLTVPLVRYDIQAMKSLNIFDSVGIACNYYGRWYDIKANEPQSEIEGTFSQTEAICGAFMLTRVSALKQCVDSKGLPGFERSYFMYKEDIEMSQRFIKGGWTLGVYNECTAFHCRGWNASRKAVPYWAKWHSAINDVDVAKKYKWRALPLALSKLIWVKYLEKK
ncbi:glycosyltransferase family 2 protein [Serratia ficaria]|uniref:glycosyltransferase family 2 protein n=1 Tax=Serratia ficaria TaxID=61651 RepID=UPI00077C6488|nr:glycosyltransferase [Serratia ficaria]CAI0865171.1 dTDP-Rha:alpha-D-GlcNAc-pyrophosphate polyprenol, alpha-3-L-rhamnosyltransferase [Serratia ficaria]CAI1544092.1 dTDP-Rha:alpha-D-GlcNAc-pyrophosphate polyprenol, alpha-3-L-rhamnosyltransferase [Serratia ficaria]CAI1561362.1 dTDP-Rha:alpha-D-GlcNAc-pyrophosphate polyprenol, alpha-3-L-rhamnosyltransferase [Serratia ficaria]CAI1729519.1 dTDP-Rha:alpha-D-GlcNAc-pyrophosphate polyprenol, alpha-3-L-rhamnosyltransferase [Serratia ficaria]CAI240524